MDIEELHFKRKFLGEFAKLNTLVGPPIGNNPVFEFKARHTVGLGLHPQLTHKICKWHRRIQSWPTMDIKVLHFNGKSSLILAS